MVIYPEGRLINDSSPDIYGNLFIAEGLADFQGQPVMNNIMT
jgi:hypothetical protein